MKRSWGIALVALSLMAFGCDDDGGIDGGGVDSGTGDAGPPAESCDDEIQNQDETDVDCGGACGATCIVGQMCGANGDCVSDICTDGVCMPMASCGDMIMNGTETGTDCGGGGCPACPDGELCNDDSDCLSLFCDVGECFTALCGNGVVEGSGEECDEGSGGRPLETADCDRDCTASMCGDGITNMAAGEECDGNDMGTGGESVICDADCTAVVCGDGVVNTTAGEDCDEGSAGVPRETATCDNDCSTAMCGDRVVNLSAGEQCDDGNMNDSDACSNTCQVNASAISIALNATFNTDTGTLNGAPNPNWSPSLNTLFVTDFTLVGPAILTIEGSNPFRLMASGNIDVSGIIDAAGEDGANGMGCNREGAPGGAGGPGGGAGGDGGLIGFVSLDGLPGVGSGAGLAGTGSDAGGGGGGHVDPGGSGTSDESGTGGTGGGTYLAVVTVEGGSGGGGGSGRDSFPTGVIDSSDDGGAGGGGGGGGVMMTAMGNLTITGTIDASGGNGGSGSPCSSGSGGGGSGGTIILYSPGTINLAGSDLDVSGGAGNTGGSDSGVGSDGELFVGIAPTCTDTVRNQDESDVDCGGLVCAGCGLTQSCRASSDCASGACVTGFCVAATCTNMAMDGMETDVDCGGAECAPCADGLACTGASDCLSGVCTGGVCQAPICTDGVQNQDESDVDCGGAVCTACPAGDSCNDAADCASEVCQGNVCQAPSCMDGVLNGGESDVDCGGMTTCPRCMDGRLCPNGPSDCISPLCTVGRCGDVRGHLVLIGHDYFAGPPAQDRVLGNAVRLAPESGVIDVLTYDEFADRNPTGEVNRAEGIITTQLMMAGRMVRFTRLTNYTQLATALTPAIDVIYLPEQESGFAAPWTTIAAAWAPTLASFLRGGGVVISSNAFDQGWRTVNHPMLVTIGGTGGIGPLSVIPAAAMNPIAAGVTPYTGGSATGSYTGVALGSALTLTPVIGDGSGQVAVYDFEF